MTCRRTVMPVPNPRSLAPALVAVALLAGGCSSISNLVQGPKVDYKTAGKLPPLEIPPDLSRPATDDRFVVPDTVGASGTTFSAYSRERGAKPSGSNPSVLPEAGDARIERAGSQRWLVVKGAPDQIWTTVRDFWRETGFIINLEVPEAGVMETDWAENRARISDGAIRGVFAKLMNSVTSTGERDKFRTRLERSGANSEIFISHRGMIEVVASADQERTIWQPRPPDVELEAEMLRRLMVRFGVQEAQAKSELARVAPTARARMTRASDGSRLSVDDPFDRAWRRVGLALDRVGFTVEDRDRSKGLYFVRYVDPDASSTAKSPGLISRLAFWRGSDDGKNRNEQYRILLRGSDAVTDVNVLDKEGRPDRSDTANRILTLLFEQLR